MRLTKDNRIIVGGRDKPFSDSFKGKCCLKKNPACFKRNLLKCYRTFSLRKNLYGAVLLAKQKIHCLVALGFGGNGITFSVVAAEILCDILCKKPNPDAYLFSFER
jgi:hypothetical protein